MTWNSIVVCSQVIPSTQQRESNAVLGVFRDDLMKFERLVALVNEAGIILADLQICGRVADGDNFIFLSVIFTTLFERRWRSPISVSKIRQIEG